MASSTFGHIFTGMVDEENSGAGLLSNRFNIGEKPPHIGAGVFVSAIHCSGNCVDNDKADSVTSDSTKCFTGPHDPWRVGKGVAEVDRLGHKAKWRIAVKPSGYTKRSNSVSKSMSALAGDVEHTAFLYPKIPKWLSRGESCT
jgi:hypothetical protein